MTDVELNRALAELGIDDMSYRALALLPLVHVAWADGQVQETERGLILKLAEEKFHLEEEGIRILTNWLTYPPSRTYVSRGQAALVGLVVRHHPGMKLDSGVLDDVRGLSRKVARAAGGLFGLGAVNTDESRALDEIAQALSIREGTSWEQLTPHLSPEFGSEPRRRVTITTNTATLDVGAPQGAVLKTELDFSFKLAVGRDPVVIGSSPDATVSIEQDPDVAPRHCELVERDRKYYVRDLGTSTGTFVDEERIVERRLLGGEYIRVGQAPFEFKLLRKIPSQMLNEEEIG